MKRRTSTKSNETRKTKKGYKKLVRRQRLKKFILRLYCFTFASLRCSRDPRLAPLVFNIRRMFDEWCRIIERDLSSRMLDWSRIRYRSKIGSSDFLLCSCVQNVSRHFKNKNIKWLQSLKNINYSTQFNKDSEWSIEFQANGEFSKIPNCWRSEV